MRTIAHLLAVTVILIVVLLAMATYHRHAVAAGARTLADHLQATTIDVKFHDTPMVDAVQQIRQKLAAKDPYFDGCSFEVDVYDPQVPITLDLTGALGSECLIYVAELSGLNCYRTRPQKVMVAHIHKDFRDPWERALDLTERRCTDAWDWAKYKIGLGPPVPSPVIPFAP